MELEKPERSYRIAILVPVYKRPEYTEKCLNALEDDECKYDLYEIEGSKGLRHVILEFFEKVKGRGYDFIGKIDNDCVVPKHWVDDMVSVFESSDVDILSPNVFPSNAALRYGEDTEDDFGYRKARIVGGLWFMKASLVENMVFEKHGSLHGLKGAIPILRQIVNENSPNIGWTTKVTVNDLGHWSGGHPEHIKTDEHRSYSMEVGRTVAW